MRRTVFRHVHSSAAVEHLLGAGVKWGSWPVPIWLELGIVAGFGTASLVLAIKQFGHNE